MIDVRKMKTSQLINRMAHTSERQAQAARDEIDRRFPVPVEREETKVNECKKANVFNAMTCALVEGHDGYHWANGFCWAAYQESPRAESTGKTIAKAVVTYCATCQQILDYPAQRCSCFAPAAPTDEWVTILDLGPGDVFETPGGNRGAKNENGSVIWLWKVGSYEGPYQPVRKLRILNPGEIAVRDDEATVSRIAVELFDGGESMKTNEAMARRILEVLRGAK